MSHFSYFKGIKRVYASLTLVSFIAANHFFVPNAVASKAVTELPRARLPKSLADISLPAGLGRIEAVHPAGEKTVVLIQDAHSLPAAQANIQRIIEFLKGKYGIDLVALEGASGRLDPRIFQSFPEQKILRRVFDEYHRRGELTGGNAAALFDGEEGIYHGIEEWRLYEEGFRLYREALGREAEVGEKLRVLNLNLSERKAKAYSKNLLAVDRLISNFYEDQIDLLPLLEKLAPFQKPKPGSEIAWILEESGRRGKGGVSIEREVKNLAWKLKAFLKSMPP